MRLLTCVFLLTGLVSIARPASAEEKAKTDQEDCECRPHFWSFSIGGDDREEGAAPRKSSEREPHSRSIAEGLSRGTLRPFIELTGKESNPGEEILHMKGFRLGLMEGGERELALAYYRSNDDVVFRPGTSYSLSYGGVVFGNMPDVDRITEGYFRLLVGTGQAKIKTEDESRTSRLLFVLEPEIGLGINITSWLQLALGVSYRYMNGLQVLGVGSEDLRGGTANLHVLMHF